MRNACLFPIAMIVGLPELAIAADPSGIEAPRGAGLLVVPFSNIVNTADQSARTRSVGSPA